MKYKRYPLTMPQFNIHSQEMAFQETDVNVLYFVISIEDTLCEDEMRKAITTFVNHNLAFHTRICMDKTVSQYFVEEENHVIPMIDLSQFEELQREQQYRAWGQTPFIYLDNPLWEFKILKLSEGKCGLFCKFHHIWCDGWSTGLIWSGILTEYCRLKAGIQDVEPPKKQEQLIPYILKQADYELSDEYKTSKAFFLKYLQGIERYNPLSISKKSVNPDMRDRKIEHKANRSPAYLLPKDLSEAIHDFCKLHHVTPYAVFMGALAVYEGGISGNEDVVLGMARLNRDTPEERKIVGEFVVELPSRINCSFDTTFANLCKHILSESRMVAEHKKYAMTHILRDLRTEEGIQGTLIKHSLSFQREKIHIDGYVLPIKLWFGSPSICAQHAVVHVVDLLEDGYQVFYDYCQVAYEETTIYNLHESLVEILKTGMKGDKKIAELSLVGEREREALCRPSNEIECPIEEGQTILSMLRRVLEQTPDRVAVSDRNRSFSFQDIWRSSDCVAAHLTGMGIEKEEAVGVLLPRTSAVICSLIGIMKAGGSFVLLDANYPKKRLKSIIKDSDMKWVVTDKTGTERLPAGTESILYKEIPDSKFEEIPILSNQRCYMIYTSGTTGKPKGVQIEHKAIYNLLQPSHTEIIGDITKHAKCAVLIGAFSFDIFLFELFTSLMNGVSVVIASEEDMKNPLKLAELMEKHQVDVICGTPSRLLSYCEMKEFHKALCNIKIMLSAGEAFLEALYDKVNCLNKTIHIYNGYGPTEAAIGTSFQRVNGTQITLGKPVTNYKLRCLDTKGRLLPYGAVGELYIGGCGLARGYTEETLTEKSFVEINGERFYRSGDLVCRRLDDELLFAGRRDNQVKVRGFRIELAEIEAAIRRHEAIKNVAVVVRKRGNAQYLCALYTAKYPVQENALKEYLSELLPHYMVPTVFQSLENMPITVNGKVDSRALSEMEIEYKQCYHAPETELQKKLADIMGNVLGLQKVDIDDNFFEIGGDSLNVAQYAVEVLAQGISFQYSDLFRNPTVRRFSECISRQNQTSDTDAELEKYDYHRIHKLLQNQEPYRKSKRLMKHVLLTGATGYLGIHVLHELLHRTDAAVYCLVRKKKNDTVPEYLNTRYDYYFHKTLLNIPEERVNFITGDLEQDNLCELLNGVPIDTVINCAANVAHYTYGQGMCKVNTESLYGMIALCKEKNANLIHISTISVGQFISSACTETKEAFTERDLYFDQVLSNEYIRSKFLAERIILEEIEKGQLKGFIARVGNLQGRYLDGKFQINFHSNAFLTRLKAYIKIGFLPQSELEGETDCSAIEFVAKAVCLLAEVEANQCIYHVINDKETKKSMFFNVLKKLGYKLEVLPDEEYKENVSRLLTLDNSRECLSDMAADLTSEMDGNSMIKVSCQETTGILNQLGFSWPEIDRNYLELYLGKIQKHGLFDKE